MRAQKIQKVIGDVRLIVEESYPGSGEWWFFEEIIEKGSYPIAQVVGTKDECIAAMNLSLQERGHA